MNNLLYQIHRPGASAFTHSGKFHADDVFSAALLLYLNPEIMITRGNRDRKTLTGSYLTSEEVNTIITRKTAGFVKTVFRTRHLVFYGRSLVQTSLGKNLRRNSTNPSCSHLITMTIQVKRTSLPH